MAWSPEWDGCQEVMWIDDCEDGQSPYWCFVETLIADVEPEANPTQWLSGMPAPQI